MTNKKSFTEEIECTLCGHKVVMEVLNEFIIKKEEYYIHGVANNYDTATNYLRWQIIQCPACNKPLLREGWSSESFGNETEPNFSIIYPSEDMQSNIINALPKDIAKDYHAAEKVKHISSNAFAVLLGRVLDRILLEKNAEGKTLNDKLDDIAKKGLIPKTIVEAAHSVRELRNIGAHADMGELTEDVIPILEDIINVILVYLYSAPDMISQVKERIERMKTANNK